MVPVPFHLVISAAARSVGLRVLVNLAPGFGQLPPRYVTKRQCLTPPTLSGCRSSAVCRALGPVRADPPG